MSIAAIYGDGLINLSGMTLTAAMISMAVFGAIAMYIAQACSACSNCVRPNHYWNAPSARQATPSCRVSRAGTGSGVSGSGLVQSP